MNSELGPLLSIGGVSSSYPEPLRIRNTFIDYNPSFPSEEDHCNLRRAKSCPGSIAYECVEASAELLRRSTHKWTDPSRETLAECAEGGIAAITKEQQLYAPSECSTSDTVPPSPACNIMTPAEVHVRSAHPWHREPPSKTALPIIVAGQGQAEQTLPSLGSAAHGTGTCKPCAFLFSRGCSNGKSCVFCHLCDQGEKKRRQREKRVLHNSAKQIQLVHSDLVDKPALFSNLTQLQKLITGSKQVNAFGGGSFAPVSSKMRDIDNSDSSDDLYSHERY